MRKLLVLSGLVMAAIFMLPAQSAHADRWGFSLGFSYPGYYYGPSYGYYDYDYCRPPVYRHYYRDYYDYPRYYSYPRYYGGFSYRYRDYDRHYYGHRDYDRHHRHH